MSGNACGNGNGNGNGNLKRKPLCRLKIYFRLSAKKPLSWMATIGLIRVHAA
jgi:hypothetical protein